LFKAVVKHLKIEKLNINVEHRDELTHNRDSSVKYVVSPIEIRLLKESPEVFKNDKVLSNHTCNRFQSKIDQHIDPEINPIPKRHR